MFIWGTRQPHTGKSPVVSTGVLAALLTALLLLSPGTARAVAQVLTQNGVALPAHVVRVLDALPAESVRDAVRKDDETVAVVASDTADRHDPAPVAAMALPAEVPPAYSPSERTGQGRKRWFHGAELPRDSSPRAPPV